MTVLWIIGLVTCGLGLIVLLNRMRLPDYIAIETRMADAPLSSADGELSVMTWNLGYGALGSEAEIWMDGGRFLRALSKRQIKAAAQTIADTLAQMPCNLLCLQEVAEPGFLSRGVDIRGPIEAALRHRQGVFWVDFATILLPRALRIRNGIATYSDTTSDHCRVVELPGAQTHMLGFIKKSYVGLATEIPQETSDGKWVVINIHLPFFNMTAEARIAHLRHVFDVATAEYNEGHHVILVGDWNTRLCDTSFPHQTEDRLLTDFSDFPQDSLPDGWTIHADPSKPTVRALDRGFEKGRTYTAIFDGFITSPNVRLASIETLDLQFAQSDHQPVIGHFQRDDGPNQTQDPR